MIPETLYCDVCAVSVQDLATFPHSGLGKGRIRWSWLNGGEGGDGMGTGMEVYGRGLFCPLYRVITKAYKGM